MEFRNLEVTPISAEDLKDVKLLGKMRTYVAAWVDPTRKVTSRVAARAGSNPQWGDKLTIAVEERLLHSDSSLLVVEIYSSGKTIVGRVVVPLHEIPSKGTGSVPLSYKVRRPSGRYQGVLHLTFKLGDTFTAPEPVTAYPPAQHGGYPPAQQEYRPAQQAYPPAQQGYAPPQQGYPAAQQPYQQGLPPQGYYQPAPAYVTQPAQAAAARPGRNSRFGLGLGAGLLGGLLVGDILSDFGDSSGYGGGDWGGGGDFGGDFGGGW